jgi:hypothetical protein
MPARVVQLKVKDGGGLISSVSLDNIGAGNYVEKTNWRRDWDQEMRREGWIKFEPNPALPADQWIFDGTDMILRLAELVRPNGERVTLGASRTEIKRFDYPSGVWNVIGSGYSPLGKRWQVSTIGGYIIFNNQVDLPTSYRVEETVVTPLYQLREVGVVSAGRMEQNSGFILFADIVEIAADQLDAWMNGYSTYTQIPTPVAADFGVASPADMGKRFDVTTGGIPIMAGLPPSPVEGFYFWLKKVDTGVGSVETIPIIGSQPLILTAQNNLALIRWDAVAQTWIATNFVDGVVPADNPYGPVPTSITNHYPWRIINGEYGDPRKWAPVFDVYMPAASASLTLPFPSSAFIAGVSRVAVINGGPEGGVLGGQSDTPNGVLVVDVAGSTITLEKSTDGAITYPRVVQVTLWEDTSSLTASYDLQGDGSKTHGLLTLQNLIVAYRKGGIYVGRYTGLAIDENGNTTGPFTWRERYTGFNIPRYGDCIANILGEYHLYPAEGGRFYAFDGNTNPVIHPQSDAAQNLFFDGIDDAYEPWALENPLTKEWWFFRNSKVFCYDYEFKTVSIIDAQIDAAVFALRPGSTDRWFILGIQNLIMTYGLVEGPTPINVWLRDGAPAVPRIRSGYIDAGDSFNEKTLLSITPVMATRSADISWTVQIYGAWNPSVPAVTLMVPPQVLPTPENENWVACFYQSLYFQYEIEVIGTVDADARLSMTIMEFDKVNAGRVNTRREQ